jgi:tetratricopeptide (TPR) repeat protein
MHGHRWMSLRSLSTAVSLGALLLASSSGAQDAAAPAQAPAAETQSQPAAAPENGEDGEGDAAPAEGAAEGEAAANKAADPDADLETSDDTAIPAEVFEQGVEAYKSGAERTAAARLFTYLKGNDPAADHYEWAEFYLAKNFERMGLIHAASEYYYNVAKEQKRAELLPEALRSLERIMNEHPYDRTLIVEDLIGSSQFGTLPPDVKTFVAYHQGLHDLGQNREKWAQRHFEVLDRADATVSPLAKRYVAKARFARALRTLRTTHTKESKAQRDARDEALKTLQELADDKAQEDFKLRNTAYRTVARLHYEEGRFDEALAAYEKIEVPFLSREEADLFLEKAWARYFNGDYRGTLGILLSLDAPSYRRHFRPERYILKALSYEALCHYAAAKGAAREFLRRYGRTLSQIRRSRDPLSDPVVRRAVVARAQPKRVLAHLNALKREREIVEGLDQASGLREHLTRMYDLKLGEVNRRLDRIVKEEAGQVTEGLLDYEEQARLLDYEVSLEVFRRLKRGSGKKIVDKQPSIPLGSKQVYYQFNGEYWNDELHDYRFRIENRCFGEKLFR